MIVDNSIISFAFNLSNGIPIKAFLGEKNDEELLYMVTFLEEVFTAEDVRKHIDKTFKLQEFSAKYGGLSIKSKREERKLLREAQESLQVKNADGSSVVKSKHKAK